MICFGLYRIQNGRNGGLGLAMCGMVQYNIYLDILQETNITNGVYTQLSEGFYVVSTDMPSRHHRGVALFYK